MRVFHSMFPIKNVAFKLSFTGHREGDEIAPLCTISSCIDSEDNSTFHLAVMRVLRIDLAKGSQA